ncbi:hypothetical protein CFP56_022854 [Quercus suber]|uniref:Uncharacterized protein n=1 Tax=Quercus suber TaxID=58331 RepID=A0AAW0KAT7_QUESU
MVLELAGSSYAPERGTFGAFGLDHRQKRCEQLCCGAVGVNRQRKFVVGGLGCHDGMLNPSSLSRKVIGLKDSILEALYHLLNRRKSNMKVEGFLVCVCASDEALGFFKAFHVLLAFLVLFLPALIGLHFQVLGVSPLETHFALILLFIIATIIYSIAQAEMKLQPPNADLPIFRGTASFVPTKLSVALLHS